MQTPARAAVRPRRPQVLFWSGARDIAPFVVGYAPMAIGIGVVIGESGVGRLGGWAGGPLISAGTAHLTLVELVAAGGSVLVAIGAALVVNSRLIAYSAGMARWFGAAPWRVRAMVATTRPPPGRADPRYGVRDLGEREPHPHHR